MRVSDDLGSHPKARAAGLPALGLWVVSGSWSSQQLTDGFVPEWWVRSWSAARYAERLTEAGLWERVDGGWLFHEWSPTNPTREQVLADRAAAAERQARYRITHAARNGVSDAAAHAPPSPTQPTTD
jgi:hypothetical protein